VPRLGSTRADGGDRLTLLGSIDKPAAVAPAPKAKPPKRHTKLGFSILERACQYVGAMPGGIQGAGGSLPCMRAAVACVRGFRLSVDETVRVLQLAHNPNCTPPWPEDQLRHKAESAAKSDRVPFGYLLDRDDQYDGDHGVDGEPADDGTVDAFGATADDIGEPPHGRFDEGEQLGESSSSEQPTAQQPLRGLRHLGAVALLGRERILELAAKPIAYVWQDIAPPGVVTLIAGPPADGKTTLLFLVFAARANLEAPVGLLGREVQPAPPGQFLVLIEGEHSEASTSRKLVRSLKLMGIDDTALARVIIVARKAVRLGSLEWADVVTLVRAGLVSDIGIDTVARVSPGDGDSEREQVAIFDGVAQAIEQAPDAVQPPNVWAVAHTRKNNTSGELADVSGSVQRVGQSDSVLLMKAERVDGRVVSTRVVFAKLREDPDEYPEPAEIVIDGGVLRTGAAKSAVADDRPLEARILDALAGGPKTKSAISRLLKRNKDDLQPAFDALFTARSIKTTTVEIKGREYTALTIRVTPYPTPYPDHAVPTPDVTPDEAEPC
jgi:hypothetical protein